MLLEGLLCLIESNLSITHLILQRGLRSAQRGHALAHLIQLPTVGDGGALLHGQLLRQHFLLLPKRVEFLPRGGSLRRAGLKPAVNGFQLRAHALHPGVKAAGRKRQFDRKAASTSSAAMSLTSLRISPVDRYTRLWCRSHPHSKGSLPMCYVRLLLPVFPAAQEEAQVYIVDGWHRPALRHQRLVQVRIEIIAKIGYLVASGWGIWFFREALRQRLRHIVSDRVHDIHHIEEPAFVAVQQLLCGKLAVESLHHKAGQVVGDFLGVQTLSGFALVLLERFD